MKQLRVLTNLLPLLLSAYLLPMGAVAQELNQTSSISTGYMQNKALTTPSDQSHQLSAAQRELLSAQRLQVSPSPMSREEVIQTHIDKAQKAVIKRQATASPALFANGIYRNFYIYNAYSRLLVDNDADGFYQTFSVTFDADVSGIYLNERADVFAELYLSRNGGSWEHYYTTDIFSILGDSTDDDFEVLTTLDMGFVADHYDVLIDLYQVGYGDTVVTVSSNDFDSLYALPLESSHRDNVYIEHDSDYAGSTSWWGLLVISLVFLMRGKRLSLVG